MTENAQTGVHQLYFRLPGALLFLSDIGYPEEKDAALLFDLCLPAVDCLPGSALVVAGNHAFRPFGLCLFSNCRLVFFCLGHVLVYPSQKHGLQRPIGDPHHCPEYLHKTSVA